MAYSSSADVISHREKYDVFLSFRGVDTRDTFTSHLHAALLQKKIETYIDFRLERGDKIGPSLREAIKKAKLSVIIFSKNYASSTWCLDELAHILECRERYGQIVVPIFYGVDPSHVRRQEESYKAAFAQLAECFKDSMESMHKVQKWRAALNEAADVAGFDNSKKAGTEADFVKKIVEDVLTKLNRKSSSHLKGLVGIESQIEKIESLLCIDSADVLTVGVWGMGGIGKSTLADAVFHRISSKFEASCFLKNVRENSEEKDGIYHLRNKLFRVITGDDNIDIDTPSIGSTFLREKLSLTKSLIVLDDVNDSRQLDFLVGEPIWFCCGSRIIVTTRDRGLLKGKTDVHNIYEVKGLKRDAALQLFHSLAFKNKSPSVDCTELSIKVVDHVKGIPLALKILGPLFLSCSTTEDWEAEWKTLKKFPNGQIQDVLRHSYNGLEENEKEIFLDIACFYKGQDMDFVKRRIDIHGFSADNGIRKLIDKSLISIVSTWKNCCEMHDLVQEMGWAIVREKCIEEPGQRDRLFSPEDVYYVLSNNTGTAKVRCISFDTSHFKRVITISGAAFKKMYNLRLLSIKGDGSFGEKLEQSLRSVPNTLRCFDWYGYPLKSLPSKFSTENLVELHMPYSQVVALLWNKDQNLGNLKWIDLSYSTQLTKIPDLSQCPKLEHIDFKKCSNLKYISEMPENIQYLSLHDTAIKQLPSSVWSMEKLSFLNVSYCKALEILPSCSCKLKLDHFSLDGCSSLGKFWNLPIYTTKLDLSRTSIEVLPSSIECLSGLVEIQLSQCKKLASLEISICKLKSLRTLNMYGCSQFEYFPEILESMEQLQFLDLSRTSIKELPSSIGNRIGLNELRLRYCMNFEVVPSSIYKLNSLRFLSFDGCRKLKRLPLFSVGLCSLEELDFSKCGIVAIPDGLFCLTSLLELRLNRSLIENIPASIKQASRLRCLRLIKCDRLQSLPELPALHCLEAHDCTSLKTMPSLRTLFTQGRLDECDENMERLHQQLIFSNCVNLDQNARRNIMAHAQLRIMEVATATKSLKFENEDYKKESFSSRSSIIIECPGNEIPNWFNYQNEGSSMHIKLPPDWFSGDFLGFAVSVVARRPHPKLGYDYECRLSLKTDNGEIHEFDFLLKSWRTDVTVTIMARSCYLSMWYNSFDLEKVPKGSTLFSNVAPEASVHFNLRSRVTTERYAPFGGIKKCGMSLVYARDD